MANRSILRILGLLLIILSVTFIPPVMVDLYYQENQYQPFCIAFLAVLSSGLLLWLLNVRHTAELKTRDGFLISVLCWVSFCLLASIPFWLSSDLGISWTDAMFEAVSGITTTGNTVLSEIDTLPHALNYYRHQLQLVGGMGVLLLVIAIFPMLGVGGMQLYRSEMTGPMKDSKLTPRIAETAKALWFIYLGLSALCVLSYFVTGMSFFNALCLGFSTISSGGFSPVNSSFVPFNTAQKLLAILFMVLSATSFALHFSALSRQSLKVYWQDPEWRFFIRCTFSMIGLVILYHWFHPADLHLSLINLAFQVISCATSTGFMVQSYADWPIFICIILLLVGILGGCAGSTSGGVKVIRFMFLLQEGQREVHHLIHPHGLFVIKIGQKTISPRIINAVWGYFSVMLLTFILLFSAFILFEPLASVAFSSIVSSFFNVGIDFSSGIESYQDFTTPGKWILIFTMLVGRLEVFPILVLCSKAFWNR